MPFLFLFYLDRRAARTIQEEFDHMKQRQKLMEERIEDLALKKTRNKRVTITKKDQVGKTRCQLPLILSKVGIFVCVFHFTCVDDCLNKPIFFKKCI